MLRGITSLATLGLTGLVVATALGAHARLDLAGPLGTGGTLLALGHGSITVGLRPDQLAWDKAVFPASRVPHNLTCQLASGSPALGDFHVGEYVAIRCSAGKLSAIQPDRQWAGGKIVKLDADSIEIGSSAPSRLGLPALPGLVCSLLPSSPRVNTYRVGDPARIGCLGGTLTRILSGNNGWNGYVESGGGRAIPPSTAGF
jgi:hypothetical protein